jgi:hypothetical protein
LKEVVEGLAPLTEPPGDKPGQWQVDLDKPVPHRGIPAPVRRKRRQFLKQRARHRGIHAGPGHRCDAVLTTTTALIHATLTVRLEYGPA